MFDNFNFPWLQPGNHDKTSPSDFKYNCIAWAAGDDTQWWDAGAYWPISPSPDAIYIGALQRVFEEKGFEVVGEAVYEDGFDTVALYADAIGMWKHAARLLPDGTWTSKMGESYDIWHADEFSVSGPAYGEPVVYMRRPTPP